MMLSFISAGRARSGGIGAGRIKGYRWCILPLALGVLFWTGCAGPGSRAAAVPEPVAVHCREAIGTPRVERISEHVWLAIGYDLASTALIRTEAGHVIIDPGMSPVRAERVREALLKEVPAAPVRAIIYTHSHIDHVGGASVWAEPATEIWATEAFTDHFFKQYGLFIAAETVRGGRQFGLHVPPADLPCGGLGPRPEIGAAAAGGVRLPTRTFSGRKILSIGGVELELIESHGETHDHLLVWIGGDGTLIAGDNFYRAFPNLYTIRGTSPRPVDDWIRSLDEMRRLAPAHLVPMHTRPLHGRETIASALTDYRDAIQWVRDETVRGANRGEPLDILAERVKLPPHLASPAYNRELYGQVDWSVRGIYDSNLGWFDGSPEKLYPVPVREAAAREVALIGGPERVLALADRALAEGDARWAVHLLAKLKTSGLAGYRLDGALRSRLALSYEKLAAGIDNTSGRAYLLESAFELREGPTPPAIPKISPEIALKVPLAVLFSQMAVRLEPERAMDVHESVQFLFPGEEKRFTVTVRRGVAEIVEGTPLPGTPNPVAVLVADAGAFRLMALNLLSPLTALSEGRIEIRGSTLAFLQFMNRFRRVAEGGHTPEAGAAGLGNEPITIMASAGVYGDGEHPPGGGGNSFPDEEGEQ
ncbi:MAG: alkyl sulfatase dimerization domain-containing protein [Syntrophales bacterium]